MKNKLRLLFLVHVVIVGHFIGQVLSLNDEGHALLLFKQSIFQDPLGSLSNWNSSDEDPCSWNGVTCSSKDQRVVSLSIPKTKLFGLLSSSIGSLSHLRHLNLRNNRMFGSLGDGVFTAQGLQSLVLYGNSFSGSLSNEVGKLKYLKILDLSQNLFNGSVPVSILQCRRLRILVLSRNNFSGSLPDGFGSSLVSLERLDLSFNEFNGSVPGDLGNLSSLQGTVDLSHNFFNGSIPESLGNLPEEVYIDLTYNNLSGPIPQNGALVNRAPTAFIGNPGLCGHPLKNPCGTDTPGARSPSSIPLLPGGSNEKGRRLSSRAIVVMIVCDIIGVCLVGWLCSNCYSMSCPRTTERREKVYGADEGAKGKQECLCFSKEESKTPSENVEQHDLVPLDSHVSFDLDELLKASAFVLGKSGIGIVYKVVLDSGLTLAVRRLGDGGSQRFREFQTEVEAIGKIRHPNIVTLRAYYWSIDEKLLIYDYIPNGNLVTALHGISWSIRLKIIKGIAKGLVYLHEFSPKKYVHGDLNTSNILLGRNMEPHIADFGVGRLANIAGGSPSQESMDNELPAAATNLGSYYQAPESFRAIKPSQKWDVYSYGVILLEMITGRSPIVHVGTSDMDIVQWIQLCIDDQKPLADVLDPYLAPDLDKEEEIITVLKVAMACVHKNPDRRPSTRNVSDALNRLATSSD